uniref:Uncharacterized protein n=1 Tax=viral metagenome TaxID=1070528 RepID=A0A6C0CKC1_9ZZZZ
MSYKPKFTIDGVDFFDKDHLQGFPYFKRIYVISSLGNMWRNTQNVPCKTTYLNKDMTPFVSLQKIAHFAKYIEPNNPVWVNYIQYNSNEKYFQIYTDFRNSTLKK